MIKHKLLEARALEGYKLLLVYAGGEQRIFDVSPYITGSWYGELKDPCVFRGVRVNNNTVEWLGGQDIAPHELYDLSVEVKKPRR